MQSIQQLAHAPQAPQGLQGQMRPALHLPCSRQALQAHGVVCFRVRDCILCHFQTLAAAEGLERLVGPVRTVDIISTGSSLRAGRVAFAACVHSPPVQQRLTSDLEVVFHVDLGEVWLVDDARVRLRSH